MKALQHIYPRWEHDPDRGEDVLTWGGHMRLVSAKRARKLRKRGVPLMPTHAVQIIEVGKGRQRHAPVRPGSPGKRGARYAWFEDFDARRGRIQARRERAAARFIKRNGAELEARMAAWLAQDPWNRSAVTFAGMDLADGPDTTVQGLVRAWRESAPEIVDFWERS